MTRSLKNEVTVQVANYLVTKKAKAFSIVGSVPVTKGRRFRLVLIRPGTYRLSGRSCSGLRLRNWIKAVSIDEAIEEAEKVLYGIRSEQPVPDFAISKVCTAWLDSRTCTKESIRCYRQFLGYFMDWLQAEGLTCFDHIRPEHLQRYAKNLAKGGMTLKSIKHYCYPVRAVARWASLNWIQVSDFSVGFRLPRVSQEIRFSEGQGRPFLTLDLAADFLLWLREQPNGWRILPGVALQALCGLRVREALRLTWSKVDLGRRMIVVDGVVKNVHSVRRIPVPELVGAILSSTPRVAEGVVSSYDQSHPYGKAVARALNLWRPGVGIEPKGLRRTIPSEAALRGWHRLALERFIGHSPVSITDRHYVGGSVSDLENLMMAEIVRKVDELLVQALEKWQRNGNLATGSQMPKSSDSKVLQLPFCA